MLRGEAKIDQAQVEIARAGGGGDLVPGGLAASAVASGEDDRAPMRASTRATSLPMPLVAPVTRAVRPLRSATILASSEDRRAGTGAKA